MEKITEYLIKPTLSEKGIVPYGENYRIFN